MSSRLIVPPVELAVSMEAARRAARVDVDASGTSPLDDDIEREVRTYTRTAEHETNRALITQTREVVLDRFPQSIQLDKSPIAAVVHVKFYNQAGVLQTLDPQDYLVDNKSEPGYIVPAPGKAWPATANRINAVEVQYVCGYGPTESSVPAEAKSYILARVAQCFAPVPNAKESNFDRLLDGLVVYLC